jgi:hypothetical protein
MSELEAIFYCFGAILWGLSGEGGEEVQALTAIALFIFFWFMVSDSGDATGPASYSVTRSRETTKASKIYGISPGRIDGYDKLIGYMGFQGSSDEPPITSIEEGISRFERIKKSEHRLFSDAKNFFSSPYVIDVLGLGEEATDSEEEGSSQRGISDYSKEIGDDWWEEGYEEGTEKPTRKTDSSGESCGNPRCSNPVSAFDFRCFTCRRRFCSEHAGSNIECSECSQ